MTLPLLSGHFREGARVGSLAQDTVLHHPQAPVAQGFSTSFVALMGEPQNIIVSAAQLDRSFSSTWQLLLERYHRLRYIANAYMDALLDLPPVTTTWRSSLQTLFSSIGEFVQILHAQPELSADMSMTNCFIARITLRKAPACLHQRLGNLTSRSVPTLHEVIDFLQAYYSAAE